VPAERNRVSDTLGQFSGLASLAGVNLRSGSDPTPLAVLKSKEFAIDFVSDPEVNRAIVAAMPSWDKPVDIRRVATYFDLKVREVQEDKRAGVVTVSIRWTDPATAAKWANLVVQRLNDKLRDRALAESEQNVEYLQKQIAGASLLPLQQSLGRVLEFEMQKLMLARGNDEFAFKIVDRAVPPIERFSPQRLLVILLSFLAGLSLAALLVLTLPRFRYGVVRS
jgi:LPS O-antigen subunit length determinant protein (WzzB/FepE family)